MRLNGNFYRDSEIIGEGCNMRIIFNTAGERDEKFNDVVNKLEGREEG